MDALIYWWFVEPVAVIAATYVLIWLGSRLVKQRTAAIWFVPAGLLVGLVVWHFVPEWDTLEGRKTFNELCTSEAGVKVLRPVILSKEQFGTDGLPVFYRSRSEMKPESRFGESYRYRFQQDWVWVPEYSDARILRKIESLYEVGSNELLGQRITIHFRPGGPPLGIAERKWLVCPEEKHEQTFGQILGRAVFQNKPTEQEKTK